MRQVAVSLPPPNQWQEFEALTVELFSVVWEERDLQLFGRSGQRQFGIDVYGVDRRQGKFLRSGVQCKRRSGTGKSGYDRAGGKVSVKELKPIVDELNGFPSKLEQFVLATTAHTDTKVQVAAQEMSELRRKSQQCEVTVWFWEDFQTTINRHAALLYGFYEPILRAIKQYNPDMHCLAILQRAFTRPFFETPFHSENGVEDIVPAIRDTQEAIRTGRHLKTDGTLLGSAVPAAQLSVAKWRDKIASIASRLTEMRRLYTEALQRHEVVQHNGFIEVRHHRLSHYMNEERRLCLEVLNEVLDEAEMDRIVSPLLDGRW